MREARVLEHARGRAEVRVEQREEEVLNGRVLVLEDLRLPLGALDQILGLAREPDIHRAAARRRPLVQDLVDLLDQRAALNRELPEERRDQATVLHDERAQEVLGHDLRVPPLARELLCGDEGLARFGGQLVDPHDGALL